MNPECVDEQKEEEKEDFELEEDQEQGGEWQKDWDSDRVIDLTGVSGEGGPDEEEEEEDDEEEDEERYINRFWEQSEDSSEDEESEANDNLHGTVFSGEGSTGEPGSDEPYGINVGNGCRIKHPMGAIVAQVSKGAGIHSLINKQLYRVEHKVIEPRDHPEVKERLVKASRDANFELTPIQVETILYAVWRPRTTIKLGYTVSWPEKPDLPVRRRFESPLTDMGSPVFVDLPPGMGKTIVCVLACMLVSIERHEEIPHQAASASSKGFAEVSVSPRRPHGGRVSMIFVPKHVHHQWKAAADKALEIMLLAYPDKRVTMEENKRASEVTTTAVDAAVVLCDSAAFGLGKALEPETVYGTLCFDESTENCDVRNNAIYSEVPSDLLYGRAIMISADFSKLADSNSKIGSARPGAMVKKIFGDASTNDFRRAVRKPGAPGYEPDYNKRHFDGGCKVAAALTMNAVFPADRRDEVVKASSDLLEGISLYTFGIKYKKSLLERLGSAAGNDLNPVNGNERFREAVGVDIAGCESVEEIVARVRNSKKEGRRTISKRASRALAVLLEVCREECPICLEGIKQASIIQPCFHVVCGPCLNKLEQTTCPICRAGISGAVTSDVVSKRTHREAFDGGEEEKKEGRTTEPAESSGSEPGASSIPTSIGDAFAEIIQDAEFIPNNDGSTTVQASMDAVLRSLGAAHDRTGGSTLRVVVVCAQVDLNVTGFRSDEFDVIKYKVKGTKKSPVRRTHLVEQLKLFQEEDGKKKLMLVHDETSASGSAGREGGKKDDSITGLDFPKLEAVVSIGRENRSQRVGRLCRMSRLFMDKQNRDAIYVELTGV